MLHARSQYRHELLPVSFWYWPAGHFVQAVAPASSLYLPSGHGLHWPAVTCDPAPQSALDFPSQTKPAGHGAQCVAPLATASALLSSLMAGNVPVEHLLRVATSGHAYPYVHGMHCVAPVLTSALLLSAM